jgi:transcriptional regulator with XRE-family HTH domain
MKKLTTAQKRARKGFPRRLAQLRGTESQRAFAQRIGVFQQNVNRYESGKASPAFDFLVHLAHVENVNLNWLVFGSGRMRRNTA